MLASAEKGATTLSKIIGGHPALWSSKSKAGQKTRLVGCSCQDIER